MSNTTDHPEPKSPDRLTKILRGILAVVVLAILAGAAALAYAYVRTPEAIRRPVQDHYHFRIQVVRDSTLINFGQIKYQTEFNKDVCTADLTKEPVHFHDKLDQFVHVHWNGITGGTLLKNYGWNFIGGTSRTLGYRFDQFPKVVRVPVHGLDLPKPPVGAHYYVYTSPVDAPTEYKERSWDDFLKLDLEEFFKRSPQQSWLEHMVPTALSHNGETHDQQDLARINNVLGNVVIFTQKDRPTDTQIKARFADLIPLPESSCGG